MTLEAFSLKWFTIYYAVFGFLLLSAGIWLAIRPIYVTEYLLNRANQEKPPPLIRNILKYWFLFTIPCLILAFIPFSWTELLFSVWSLLMIYLAGTQLLRWPQVRLVLRDNKDILLTYTRRLGAGMVSVAVIIFMLAYLMVQQLDV